MQYTNRMIAMPHISQGAIKHSHHKCTEPEAEEGVAGAQAEPNLPEINVQRCVRTYEVRVRIASRQRRRVNGGVRGSVRGVVLADIVAGNLKLVRSSFAVVEACLRQIQFDSMHFRLEAHTLRFFFSQRLLLKNCIHISMPIEKCEFNHGACPIRSHSGAAL